MSQETIPRSELQLGSTPDIAGEIAADGEQLANAAEFQIGDTNYIFHGVTGRNYMAFSSMAPDGVVRPFLVYRSSSGGSYRVSQGIEQYKDAEGNERWRLMKGQEDSKLAQYTQDTQLHPAFYDATGPIEDSRDLMATDAGKLKPYSDEEVKKWYKDFESQVSVHKLATDLLHEKLLELQAGGLSSKKMEQLTGFDMQADYGHQGPTLAFERKIAQLNDELESSGCMPDFSAEPIRVGMSGHAQLGSVVQETFRKEINGQKYDWVMAHDMKGRVWIERIRFAESEPTPYGTDKDMVYSGVLTSKPFDYIDQTTGIPPEQRKDMGNGYADITEFLKTLAPIREYEKYYHRRDGMYHGV